MSPTGRTEGGSGSGSSSISAPQGQTTWSAVTLTASTNRLSPYLKSNKFISSRRNATQPNHSACHTNLTGLPCSFLCVCHGGPGRVWKRHYPQRNEPTSYATMVLWRKISLRPSARTASDRSARRRRSTLATWRGFLSPPCASPAPARRSYLSRATFFW